MIFTAERAALLEAVTKAQRVVGAKTSMPILEGILLSAEQGKVTLVAYNLEMGIKKEIYAHCEEAGDIVINARLLADILRRMNGLQVEISCDERLNCHIKCGEATFDIMGMAAIDFPEMPFLDNGDGIKVSGKIFSEMIKETIFSVAQTEGSRPVLTGVYVTVENGVLQFVSIDGYRLAIRREKINETNNYSFIVPGKALTEVMRLIDEETEDVIINIGARLISFDINGYKFISRLFEGEFVNYQKTIPAEHKQLIKVNTRELISVIERVSLLINESFSTPVRCYFNEHCVVFTSATSVGRATETFNIELEGEPFEIGLNSKYLLEALKAIQDEQVEILFNGAGSGVIIKQIEGDDFKYMIMPMRI